MTHLGTFKGVNRARSEALASALSAVSGRALLAIAAATWLSVIVLLVRLLTAGGQV